MSAYLIRRAFSLIPILLLMSVIVFTLIRLVPGDPIDVMYGSEGMDAIRRAALSHELGLDESVVIQYVKWLGRALTGDLGRSYKAQMSVTDLIAQRLPATLFLSAAALAFSLLLAIPLGVIAAIKRNSWIDFSAMGFAILGISLPNFWAGIMFVLIFAVYLGWLPSIGYVSPFADFGKSLQHLILPAITLGWSLAGATSRLTRSSMLEELGKDYVRTARGKGLGEKAVLLGHALRNAMIPTVTMVGLQLGFLIGGAVVVETVFAWPGIGLLVVDSIFGRDYPVVQGVVLVIAVLVVVVNLTVDLIYTILDPRIRLG
ncbi:Glutathione transport system permease protein GsiC [Anaerolineae bacterium]|nr:Glutathione transport system permease protein GsiC [Anaerolineae bacterium]